MTISYARQEQLKCAAYIEANGWDEGAALGMFGLAARRGDYGT